METSIAKAVRLVGGQAALANAIHEHHPTVKQQHVWKWVRAGRVPAEYVRAIEAATGWRVTRYQLRPDVFGSDPSASPHTRRVTDHSDQRGAEERNP